MHPHPIDARIWLIPMRRRRPHEFWPMKWKSVEKPGSVLFAAPASSGGCATPQLDRATHPIGYQSLLGVTVAMTS
jgi:hypothetical protein